MDSSKLIDPIASIEIGTNSIRMLIAERGKLNGTLKPVLRKRSITRLGEDFSRKKSGSIKPEAMTRSISVLKDFFDIAAHYHVTHPRVVATGVVRKATNRATFINLIAERLGRTITIISGRQEADLTWKGVFTSMNQRGENFLVFDLGGGSSEFIFNDNKEMKSISIDLGAVTLTEDYIIADPPTDSELQQLTNYIEHTLQTRLRSWKAKVREPFTLVGTGGTAVTLAAMIRGIGVIDFEEKLNGLIVEKKEVRFLFKKMRSMAATDRRNLKGLETGREDVILAGTLMVMNIMEYFKKDEIIVSHSDLLEGILVDYMEGENNG